MLDLNTTRLHSIWALTWPQLIMLLCQFVIGITDVWTAGRISADAQAVVGLIAQCQMLLMTLVVAASGGAVAAISQSFGAGQPLRARRYVSLVVFGCIVLGGGLASLSLALRTPLLGFVQTPDHILPTAESFYSIYMWSLPGQYVLSIGGAVFRAAKSVVKPLYAGLVACGVNVLGDLALGLGWWGFPNMGATGVAWATLLSVGCGAACMLLLLIREQLLTLDSIPPWRWVRVGARYLIRVAAPALGTSLLWQTGYLVLFVITATLPTDRVAALAGLTAGLRIEALLFLPAVAFNMTASVLVGHTLGSGNPTEARRIVLVILGVACSAMSVIGACMWPFRMEIAGLLAPDPSVQLQTASYLSYNILSVPFTVGSVVLTGSLTGAGATIYPLLAYCVSIWMVRLPLAWCVSHFVWKSADGVFLSMLVSQMVQSLALLWVVLRCHWSRFAMHRHDNIKDLHS